MRQPPLRMLTISFALACSGALGCSDDGECPPGQINVGGGACRSPGAGGGGARTAVCGAEVKINEVLYDPEGSETEVTTSFIELRGPAGTALDDWYILRVKKSGADGRPIVLAGAIGPSGYFVVGEGDVLDGGVVPDMVDPGADGQQKDYAFVLDCNGEVVDAVAWGPWVRDPPEEGEGVEGPETSDEGPQWVFPGEDRPADTASSGMSLSRCPDGGDSGNNARDFAATVPTPGAASADCPDPPPECPPGAAPPVGGGADLVLNEIAARSVEYGEERAEFLEIVNTAATAVDVGEHVIEWNPGEEEDFAKSKVIPAGLCVPAGGALLLWGGGAPPPTVSDDVVVLASGALQIRDSGGEIRLVGPGGGALITQCYNEEGCPSQPAGVSLSRDPDADPDAPWVRHDQAERSGGAASSPGACQNTDAFSAGCDRVPEPPEVEPDPACDEAPPTGLMINEVGFDPPESGWEFVELYNGGAAEAALAGLALSDAVGVKYTFPDDADPLPGGAVLVVMAVSPDECPAPESSPFDAGVGHACAGSLGLNNGGDTVTLSHGDPTADPADPDLVVVDAVVFGEPATPCLHALQSDTSYTRAPDGGAGWRSHLSANPGLAQSPGLRVDGTRF